MTNKKTPLQELAVALYEKHVKPVEDIHKDEYVLVTEDGQTLFSHNIMDLFDKGPQDADSRNIIFKVGDRVLGKFHTPLWYSNRSDIKIRGFTDEQIAEFMEADILPDEYRK
jgi:hypothetical protein